MRSKSLLPIAGTVAAVTAVAVTVALVQPSKHDPRPLRLAAGGATSTGTRDAAMAAGSIPASGSGYTLTGTLPAGQPDDAPAYTLPKGPADAAVVTALARALHAGTPVRDGDGWRAGGLFVSGDAGQSWWWAPCAADAVVKSGEQVACASPGIAVPAPVPVDGSGSAPNAGTADGSVGSGPAAPESSPGAVSGSGGTSTGTAVAPPPPAPDASPVPEPSPMSEDAVRAAVQPLFDALGLDLGKARVEGWPYGGSATLTRTVGGLEVSGLQTSVQVDRDGKVQSAGGSLSVPDKGDSYPLVTAQAAYDDLPPMMTAMMCPVSPDGKGCGSPQPTEITGAHLGLMMQALVGGEQALVPAWLFEVKGWTEPLAVVAVQAKYLATDEPTDPATVKPDPGEAIPPMPPASTEPGPAPTRVDFAFEGASRGASTDEVVVRYGDSSSCAHQNVTSEVKEDPTTVYVVLQADAQPAGIACTQDYRGMSVVVALQAPLGDRKVVDATTGKQVPIS